MVRETVLDPSSFIYPLFVMHGRDARREIPSMPGQFQLTIDQLPAEADELRRLGIPAVLPVRAAREHGRARLGSVRRGWHRAAGDQVAQA